MVGQGEYRPLPTSASETRMVDVFTLHTVTAETVASAPVMPPYEQVLALKGLQLLVEAHHLLWDRVTGARQPVVEVSVSSIVAVLGTLEDPTARQLWQTYQDFLVKTNPSYGHSGVLRKVGPTLDLLASHGELMTLDLDALGIEE